MKFLLTLFKGPARNSGCMLGRTLAPVMLAALVAPSLVVPVTWARAAGAQEQGSAPCRLCSATGERSDDRPALPLRLEVQTRLEFDKVVFGGLGDARLALAPSGTATLSGAAQAAGARAMPGSVIIRGEPGRAVRVELPQSVQLFGEGRGSLRIDSIVTDLPAFPRIDDNGSLSFRFGGDLKISGDSDGAYRGSVEIVVEYL